VLLFLLVVVGGVAVVVDVGHDAIMGKFRSSAHTNNIITAAAELASCWPRPPRFASILEREPQIDDTSIRGPSQHCKSKASKTQFDRSQKT
jgi:hypothetical protein